MILSKPDMAVLVIAILGVIYGSATHNELCVAFSAVAGLLWVRKHW